MGRPELSVRITRGLPVLLYHAFSEGRSPDRYVVSKRDFARQMRALALLRYRVIGFDDIARALRDGHSLPRRAVAITIDDGYVDNLEVGHAVLRRRGFAATVFLVSGRVGRENDWTDDGMLSRRPLLTREEISRLHDDGIAIGAHTRTHPSLPDASGDEVLDEVAGSRADLEDLLGTPVTTFAYPYGRYDDRAVSAAGRAGFLGAGTTEPRLVNPDDDPLLIPRVEIRASDSLARFLRKLWFGGS